VFELQSRNYFDPQEAGFILQIEGWLYNIIVAENESGLKG